MYDEETGDRLEYINCPKCDEKYWECEGCIADYVNGWSEELMCYECLMKEE